MSSRDEVIEVVSRYVRLNDEREPGKYDIWADDVEIEVFRHDERGARTRLAGPFGKAVLLASYDEMMPGHAPGAWSHHVTSDHIVTVDGDFATVNTQFVMFRIRGHQEPAAGWPSGTFGAQGTITPEESGYYEFQMTRTDGVWRISGLRVIHDMPFVFAT